MKKPRDARRTALRPEPVPPVGKPMSQAELREGLVALIHANAYGMVEETIRQVHGGHYQAMKYLFEVAGLFPGVPAPDEGEAGGSLAEVLLRQMGISGEPSDEAAPVEDPMGAGETP